ncbi:hypothetical protein DL95DRAFT_231337, partial [Leptodontidium sp. 2 PMI_412]
KREADFVFEKFLEYVFIISDVKFFATLGLNYIWIAFYYRYFNNDMNPQVLKKTSFKYLDSIIKL